MVVVIKPYGDLVKVEGGRKVPVSLKLDDALYMLQNGDGM
jgi:hypothetical protein